MYFKPAGKTGQSMYFYFPDFRKSFNDGLLLFSTTIHPFDWLFISCILWAGGLFPSIIFSVKAFLRTISCMCCLWIPFTTFSQDADLVFIFLTKLLCFSLLRWGNILRRQKHWTGMMWADEKCFRRESKHTSTQRQTWRDMHPESRAACPLVPEHLSLNVNLWLCVMV